MKKIDIGFAPTHIKKDRYMKMSPREIQKEFGDISNKDWQWIRLKVRWVHLLSHKDMKCKVCNETDIICLEFHHRDPNEKENQISYLNMGYGTNGNSFEEAKQEIEKCDLLCRRCHYEIHNKNVSNHKRRLLKISGKDRCEECGYDKLRCLDFHHLYGKDFTIGRSAGKSDQELQAEISKCRVLCKNCHKKAHKDMSKWKYIDKVKELAIKYDDFGWVSQQELIEDKVELIKELYSLGNKIVDISKEVGFRVEVVSSFIREKIDSGLWVKSWRDCIKDCEGDRGRLYPEINEIIDGWEQGKPLEIIGAESGKSVDWLRSIFKMLRNVGIRYSRPRLEKVVRVKHEFPHNKGKFVLTDIHRKIMELRGLGKTAKEMGEVLGKSGDAIRLQVSKLIKKGLLEPIIKR